MVVAQVLSLQELVQVCLHEILHNISAQCHVKETSTVILCFDAHNINTLLNIHIFVQSTSHCPPQNKEATKTGILHAV